METFYKPALSKVLSLIFLFALFSATAQDDSEIVEAYEDYTDAPREIAYAHLNKSTYIKNEMLGFKVYILDKTTKSLSVSTSNLYCIITDSTNKIIKKKLVKVTNGVASNIFNIDSLFTSGKYTFKAYTNWMLNFNESNFFEQSFFVIDPDIQSEPEITKIETNYSIQVLPEGGHLLEEVQNTIGVVVKNRYGIGLSNANGNIIDQNNTTITTFKLNRFGIAKSLLTPKANNTYRVVIVNDTEEIATEIEAAKRVGITMSLNPLKDDLVLSLRTNKLTPESFKVEDYTLVIHNGNEINTFLFNFERNDEINKVFKPSELSSGINIFTIFDPQNKPLLERLYFNYNGFVPITSHVVSAMKVKDSLNLKLKLSTAIDSTKINTISISVLPSETASYNSNSTIISKTHLEPHVKGFIQNPNYYFNSDNSEAKYDLDNLLITQGWSSYDWNQIFNEPPSYSHNFENGINTVVNINGKNKQGVYITNAINSTHSQIFVINESDSIFNQIGLFPYEIDSYKIYRTNSKQTKKPQLYVQYVPSSIPLLSLKSTLPNDHFIGLDFKSVQPLHTITPSWDNTGVYALDEVLVTADTKEKARIEKIRAGTFGQVNFIDDETRKTAVTLQEYLSKFGYRTTQVKGFMQILDRRTNKQPIIIFDNQVLGRIQINVGSNSDPIYVKDLSPLTTSYQMSYIDYIEINKNGLGSENLGVSGNSEAGGSGYIKIVTDPFKFAYQNNAKTKNLSEHKFPLAFSNSKKFYVPNYGNYNSIFFKEYGTLAWLPDIRPDHNGLLDFNFYDTNMSSINLYIEGVLDDGTFISEIKTIELNK